MHGACFLPGAECVTRKRWALSNTFQHIRNSGLGSATMASRMTHPSYDTTPTPRVGSANLRGQPTKTRRMSTQGNARVAFMCETAS